MSEESWFASVPKTLASVGPSTTFQSTVLVCDIRGFTQLLEKTTPEDAFQFIEKFLHSLTLAVIQEGGSVNNLTGDGFLAQFGIGLFDDSHALRAVNCAIELRQRLQKLNRELHIARDTTFRIGIGLHSGVIAGGHVQLGHFSSFLIVGDTINVAARIESLTKDFAVDILLSSATFDKVKDHHKFMPMAPRAVKGKSEMLATYWIPPQAKTLRNYILEI
ncbi:MAG: adenylate/guanylate cyclase domain-containing protein [Methylotenera sp.]|nr:adenylate/guanylate cyclase domain-containing protein [Oligoflexia bacterium]